MATLAPPQSIVHGYGKAGGNQWCAGLAMDVERDDRGRIPFGV